MKLSHAIFLGFTVILLLFSFTTFVNFRQSQAVKENTEWVARSQGVIRDVLRYQRNISDLQSSLRGYFLTGDESLMEPYYASEAENKQLISELNQLMPAGSLQLKKLKVIENLNMRWKTEYAQPLIEARNRADESDAAANTFRRFYGEKIKSQFEKQVNQQMRDEFREITNIEYGLRSTRRAVLDKSVAQTRSLSITLTVLSIAAGFSIALYLSYHISRRINEMVSMAQRITEGKFDTILKDTSKDELSHLAGSLNRMARILDENISQLERKNQELDRFSYVVSHDLKAPLRGIENVILWTEEDFGDNLPPKMLEYVGLVKKQINRMSNFIEGLLALSKIGRERRVLEWVDTGQMLTEIIELLSPGSGLRVIVPGKMPKLYTEKLPLQQIFINLISNAIKYHDRQEGQIAISYDEHDHVYEFKVTDDGPGIDPQYHQKIFIIFQTLKPKDEFESTGVGLAIVKKILDDRKCTIRVDSDPGKGASFIFTWPKAAA